MLHLKCTTPKAWIETALANLDQVLVDHAHCEHKAAVTALALTSQYPDHLPRVRELAALAQEEAGHFADMVQICNERGLQLGRPPKDSYVKALLNQTRQGYLDHLVDRLLICSIIEARSCERLKLLAENLSDAALRKTYDSFWRAEAGHHMLFIRLAEEAVVLHKPTSEKKAKLIVLERLEQLAEIEAAIVLNEPIRPAIH